MKTLVVWHDSEGPAALFLLPNALAKAYKELNGKILNRDEMGHAAADTCEHLAMMLGKEPAYAEIPPLNKHLRDRLEFHDRDKTPLEDKCIRVETEAPTVNAPFAVYELTEPYKAQKHGTITEILVTGWFC